MRLLCNEQRVTTEDMNLVYIFEEINLYLTMVQHILDMLSLMLSLHYEMRYLAQAVALPRDVGS